MQVPDMKASLFKLERVESGQCFLMRRQDKAYVCLKTRPVDEAETYAVLWSEDSQFGRRLIRHTVPLSAPDVMTFVDAQFRPSINPADILLTPPMVSEPDSGVLVLAGDAWFVFIRPGGESLRDVALVNIINGAILWQWPSVSAIFPKWEIVVRTHDDDEWETLCAFG